MPRHLAIIAVALLAATPLAAQDAFQVRADSIFARFTQPGSPGCALGVERNGTLLAERAWGLANIEDRVPITPATIFEAGSVSKQFTAAAVLLLAQEGKLSLDDDVRRWVPELPDYGTKVTVRHLIHHTSGLRDWGSIAGIGGWPRNTRALNHAHVLDILSRITELNFPPGTEYDYSNSNYNLLAIIAERVSGQPFPEFTRERLFEPLGMTRTSWRDDATRLVPGRAPSYSPEDGEWRSERAVESIYGNCCLLTTVGDLLKWNAAIDAGRIGGAEFRTAQERRGVLVNGRTIEYAAGLFVEERRGVPLVAHGGATAGYRAYLARLPEHDVSVAVLCNAGNANPTQLALGVVEGLIEFEEPTAADVPVAAAVPVGAVLDRAGLYRNLRNMMVQRFVVRDGRLETENGVELVPQSPAVFVAETGGARVVFGDGNRVAIITASGDTVPAERVQEPSTDTQALAGYTGEWYSAEADVTVRLAVEDGSLVLTRAPDLRLPLEPAYRDGFASRVGMFVFGRDPAGHVAELRFTTSRVRNLRFVRTGS